MLHKRMWVPLPMKLAVLFGAVVLAFCLFLYVYYSNIFESQYRAAANDKSATIAAIFASSLAPALEFNDAKTVDDAIRGLTARKDVEFCVVSRRDGSVISAYNRALAEQSGYKASSMGDSLLIVGELLVVRQPVMYSGASYGTVFLGVSIKDFIAKASDMRTNVAIVMLLLFAGGMVIIITFSDIVTRSVRAVALAAERISAGDLTQRVEIRANDETGELAAAFNDMVEKLAELISREREVMAIRARFLGTVSHEFRTPLTGILISTELLEAYGTKMNTEQIQSEIRKIKMRVHDLRTLMDDFMLHSSADSLREMFNPSNVNLTALLGEVIERHAPLAASAGVALSRHFDSAPIVIRGDQKLLQYVFINLIVNAIKYSLRGGEVDISLRSDAVRGIVEIHDAGIGIPPEEADKIFRPFFRAGNASQIPGAGLGLSIAKEFTELHHGELSFRSNANGTVFTIGLPLANSWAEPVIGIVQR